LYLRLFATGGSHAWRLDDSLYRVRNNLSLGTDPDTTLTVARRNADKADKAEQERER
jgi:hypothetical protein